MNAITERLRQKQMLPVGHPEAPKPLTTASDPVVTPVENPDKTNRLWRVGDHHKRPR